MSSTVRVLLVDDQQLVREGILRLLELNPMMDVVGEADNGVTALTLLSDLDPDVLLLDIRMPGMSGLDMLVEMNKRNILTPTILLTTFGDGDYVTQAKELNAKAFLLKDVSSECLMDVIVRVSEGGEYFPDIQKPKGDGLIDLTVRETEILQLISKGMCNKEIANSVHLSEGTIKNKVSKILSKLRVRDRTQAVLKYHGK